MTRDQAMLLILTGGGALLLLTHFVLLARTLRATGLPRRLRLLAWLPPCTPFVAWAAGARRVTMSWIALAIAYAVLWWGA